MFSFEHIFYINDHKEDLLLYLSLVEVLVQSRRCVLHSRGLIYHMGVTE